MNCPKCGTEMVPGIAIESEDNYCRSIVPRSPIKAEDLKLIDVLKCPACGHSDDGKLR